MILWLAILVSKKLVGYRRENTFSHLCSTKLRPTSRVVTYVWHQKRWGINPTVIFNPYWYSLIGEKTYWWTLWLAYLPISTNWKWDNYDSILVIVDRLTKMVHYKPVKIIVDALGIAKVIIDVIVCHHGLPNLIVIDRGSLFTSKFWSSRCYFLDIKRRLSTTFHPQTDSQTERKNNTIEVYLQAFVNFE